MLSIRSKVLQNPKGSSFNKATASSPVFFIPIFLSLPMHRHSCLWVSLRQIKHHLISSQSLALIPSVRHTLLQTTHDEFSNNHEPGSTCTSSEKPDLSLVTFPSLTLYHSLPLLISIPLFLIQFSIGTLLLGRYK